MSVASKRRRILRSALLAALLLGLTGLSAACGEYPGVEHPLAVEGEAAAPAAQGESPATTAAPSENPPAAGEGGEAGGADTGGAETGGGEPAPGTEAGEPEGPPSTVEIVEKDFELVPDEVTAKAGTITFVLKNEGRYTHDFRVEGQGVDDKAPKIGAGRTFEWEITLEPGKYEISCPVSNHAKRGMKGTLEVVA